MKKILLIYALFTSPFFFAQQNVSQNQQDLNSQSISLRGSEVKAIPGDIDGSPYLYSQFVVGQVDGFPKKYEMRYNLYSDEVEFMKNGEAVVLAKSDAYSTVNFVDTQQILKLVHFTYRNSKEYGYLFEIFHKNDITVYSRFSVTYIKAQKGRSSYDIDIKASYRSNPEVFFIKNGTSEIVEMPTSKKKMIEMFPSKKQVLNDYFKLIKVDFSKPVDLQKLVSIL